jgi:hypothetical protein
MKRPWKTDIVPQIAVKVFLHVDSTALVHYAYVASCLLLLALFYATRVQNEMETTRHMYEYYSYIQQSVGNPFSGVTSENGFRTQ